MRGARLGVDVGGTFTDLVALVDGRLITAKVPTTPGNQARGVVSALEVVQPGVGDVSSFVHGSTVATNALLERRGARTALVTTEGFRDVIEIGRQNRAALYDLTRDRPAPLVPRELRFTVRERMGRDGVLIPLDPESVRAAVDACGRAGVEAVAVCLLFGFLHPEHEQKVGKALREALPGIQISLSSAVLPEFREYERCSTTVCNSYLAPRLGAYLESLADEVAALGLPSPLVMQSSGGAAEIKTAAAHGASCLLSGPAGGVVGAAWVAGLSGFQDLLTFDMGGTSTDVAPVLDGTVQTTTESVVAGVPVKLPMVDVHTVSAGGGSIAWVDAGGALRVGPSSAGADPGPAAYGRGGREPTVTDANLYLGYLPDGAALGGEVRLGRGLAEAALRRVGARIGLDSEETARGIIRVADAEMIRALRVISIERGLDPRELTLVAFGGAGGLHACSLAEELGIGRILVPLAAGVLSALGLAIADIRRDQVHPFLAELETADRTDIEACLAGLEANVGGRRVEEASLRLARLADLRYQGQSFELTVDATDLEELAPRFHAEHERRYGYRMEDEVVELVSLRLVATVPRTKPDLAGAPPREHATPTLRRASFDGGWQEIEVHDRADIGMGSELQGPAVVEFAESTLLIRPGWRATVDKVGTLNLERQR
jgi:N-methylhydantoinase A